MAQDTFATTYHPLTLPQAGSLLLVKFLQQLVQVVPFEVQPPIHPLSSVAASGPCSSTATAIADEHLRQTAATTA